MNIQRLCVGCFAALNTTDERVKYCSPACAQNARREKMRQYQRAYLHPTPPSWDFKTETCKNPACGQSFVVTHALQKYCSPACREVMVHQRDRIDQSERRRQKIINRYRGKAS